LTFKARSGSRLTGARFALAKGQAVQDFMAWLEMSALGVAMRETGVWTYALVNLAHIFGISLLFGAIVVLDLRLLGVWSKIPLDLMARPTTVVAGTGFAVAVLTGPALLATKATEYVGNPFLPIKLVAIVLGIINIAILHGLPAWKQRANPQINGAQRKQLVLAGSVSLLCWVSAISAARLIAYW
jgi:hypothetical protein